ncbi:DUF551 domain-containing protein [Enterobacter kobei]|uniref:DUF551 domain-containing protein n=1 Tax=Enterobacter kobei TaxID=208224 RepID=UPI002238E3EA|nr:DUF551 domain-containing protein [Enterobacter kobei]MCW4704086.1 DUF551 domain-containing protein [Enterobacter kobei]
MSTITKERLEQLANFRGAPVTRQEEQELARIALASLEAEAVCVIDQSNLDYLKSGSDADVWPASRTEMGDVLLYRAAPPAPASVPDDVTAEDCPAFIKYDLTEVDEAWARGFNACRDAMLQGAENADSPSGNSPVIPDGWVACSDKNPEKGRWLALFGKRTKENCDPYVDEGYLGSDGEFYFFDWESGPRIDDCHPYDKAIVSHWMYWELPAAPKREDL